MEPDDLLRHARDVCESIGLGYFVVGSIATIAYGEPRYTNNLDIVIELRPQHEQSLRAIIFSSANGSLNWSRKTLASVGRARRKPVDALGFIVTVSPRLPKSSFN